MIIFSLFNTINLTITNYGTSDNIISSMQMKKNSINKLSAPFAFGVENIATAHIKN